MRALLIFVWYAAASTWQTPTCDDTHTPQFAAGNITVWRPVGGICERIHCVDNMTWSCVWLTNGDCKYVAGNILMAPTVWIRALATKCRWLAASEMAAITANFSSSAADCCAIDTNKRETAAAIFLIGASILACAVYGIVETCRNRDR